MDKSGSAAEKLDDAPLAVESGPLPKKRRPWGSRRESRLPVVSDTAFWAPLCKPLHDFVLVRKRNWTELRFWGLQAHVTQDALRNMLAWLEEMGLADGDASGWTGRPFDSK